MSRIRIRREERVYSTAAHDRYDGRRGRGGGFVRNMARQWDTMLEKDNSDVIGVLRSTDEKTEDATLKPKKVDFHEEINQKDHHTDEYENSSLIIRRGQVFNISVTFDRPVDEGKDLIMLQFVTGSQPKQSKNSIIRVQETKTLSTSSWGIQVIKKKGSTVDLSAMSPADAIVGEYSVYVETKTKGPDGKYLSFRQEQAKTIVVLFNAWCKDDIVFMENEDHRKEYVLNVKGRIWRGSKSNFKGSPWNFGQFEEVSLKTCLELMEMAELKEPARSNPSRICRAISKMVNSNDDNGVLVGRWSSPYTDGKTPTSWTGSVAILKEFSKTKKPVKYGQCWVFSGLVTTLLRAIGIPTRSVTNFASAHDTDHSMTIDYHFDAEGDPIERLNNDSVWNYHVWNESFFTRPDLPSGYDGWQAHDATPQETSEGVFQCGPCPVKAIKKGEVYMPYDAGFVFGEVNGDKVYWDMDKDGEMKVSLIDKKSVGKKISTKAVGSNDREDLTEHYKFPEGSKEERNAVKLANKFSSRKDKEIYSKPLSNDVSFEVQTSEKVMIGDEFDIKLFVKNTSREKRTIQVTVVAKATYYTGITAADLKAKKQSFTVAGEEDTLVTLPITVDDYAKMASDASIKVYFKAKVEETGQSFGDMDVVEFVKPELEAGFPEDVKTQHSIEVTFSFTNPLPVQLKNCTLNIESFYMVPSTITETIRKPILPHAKVSIPITVQFKKKGWRFVDAVFDSEQLSGVDGEFEVHVV